MPEDRPLVSASQINLFRDCQRKWGFKYLDGIEDPSGPAAALGTEVDDTQLQPYLLSGTPFDYTRASGSGYIAATSLAYLPKPLPQTPGLEVQKHFVMPSPSTPAFGYQGYIDLYVPDGRHVPGMTPGVPFVGDFKTTSDIVKWGKTPDDLKVDTQAMLYAMWAFFHTGAPAVDLGWIYMQTKGKRKATLSHLRPDPAHVAAQFQAIDATANEMFAIRQAKRKTLDLLPAPDIDTCTRKFGGCPHRATCNIPLTKTLAPYLEVIPTMSNPTLDLLARLKGNAPAAPAPAVAPPPVAPAPVFIQPPAIITTGAPPQPVMGMPDTAVPAPPPGVLPSFVAAAINPPESALPPPPPPVAAPPEAKRTRGRPKKDDAPAADAPVTSDTEDALDIVTVTWGKETFEPLPGNAFEVGPFMASASVRASESRGDVMRRLDAELFAFATEAKANKLDAFVRTVAKINGGA